MLNNITKVLNLILLITIFNKYLNKKIYNHKNLIILFPYIKIIKNFIFLKHGKPYYYSIKLIPKVILLTKNNFLKYHPHKVKELNQLVLKKEAKIHKILIYN